jgi:AraC-like DNA-binding protein
VIQGKEIYHSQNKSFNVNSGEFIVGNDLCNSEIVIDSTTKGLCLDISKELVLEIAKTYFNQPDFIEYLTTKFFLIEKYDVKNSRLTTYLESLALKLKHENYRVKSAMYFDLAEIFVFEQANLFKQISKLDFKKQEVIKENYRQLKKSKAFINERFLENLNTDQLARIALMSKYKFLRLFKKVFEITPYQYIIEQRLNHAKLLISRGEEISDVAIITGFADTPSFSKAFKRRFAQPPSQFAKKQYLTI